MIPARRTWHRFRAGWRDTALLVREFRQPLVFFALAMLTSGWLYQRLSLYSSEPVHDPVYAVYITMMLSFLQPIVNFPEEWYLQIFFFIMPVIGISLLAQGLTDFGVMLFNRRARHKEWEMAVASTFNNHVVLVGLGHLGYRVVKQLTELDQDVVAIEVKPNPDLVENVRKAGVPVIEDDGARENVLINAGIQRARAVILCTQNDSLNLRMALKARNLNPKIEVIIRIFDDEFATSLQSQFGFHAMSATGIAAPLFAATAAQVDVTPPISIDGKQHILANISIHLHSRLIGKTVSDLEETYRVSIVLLCNDGTRNFHPAASVMIQPGQTVAIFGEPERIRKILHENHR